jgi:PKD repeat protein
MSKNSSEVSVKRLLLSVASVVFVMATVFPSLARGQAYPMPGSESEPPVICTTCSDDASKNKPTWAYQMPIKDFVGRWVDSQATRGYQDGTGYRTVRAKKVLNAPELNRVFTISGEGLEITDYNTFYTQRLRKDGKNLIFAPGRADPGTTREKYLPGQMTIYAEWEDSGWITNYMDGQERLFDADYDDRGYVYLAYSIFGWGIHKDQGSTIPLVFQTTADGEGLTILSVRSGSSYNTLISDGGTLTLYDTTNPTAPFKLVSRSLKVMSIAKGKGTDPTFAIVDGRGDLHFYTIDGFKRNTPQHTVTDKKFRHVTSDGTNFYAARPNEIVVFTGGTFAQAGYPTDLQATQTLNWGVGGFLAAGGYDRDGRIDGRVWKLENGAPRSIDLKQFFRKYYNTPPDGYAKPLNYTTWIRDFRVEKHGTRVLMFWSNDGLGDVFELQAADNIDIAINTAAGYGTANPYSGGGSGPFYGDPITFTGTYKPGPIQISWNFDNAGAPGNTATTTTDSSIVYQYSGLSTSTAITTPRQVTAQAVTDSSNTDSVNVSMLAPTARFALAGTNVLFPNASSQAPIVLGDLFVDASDGSVQGHYSKWTLDASAVDRVPSDPQPVGSCGVRSLTFAPQYGPYTITSGVATHLGLSTRYAPAAITLGYTVRPFVPQITIASTTSTGITFKNATRIGDSGAFTAGPSTPVSVTWRHVSATGTDLVAPVTRALTLGTLASDTYAIASKTNGSKVVLSVAIDAGQIVDTTCGTYATASSEFALVVPDPTFSLTGCLNEGQPCSATASSVGGQSMTDWTYQWVLNSVTVGTTQTVNLTTLLKKGPATLKLTASNAIGSDSYQQTWTVGEPIGCTVPPGSDLSIYASCTTCNAGQSITFGPTYWSYKPQDCDKYKWEFSDGTSSTEMRPAKAFNTNGTYTVKLTVTNEAGSVTKSTSITIGTSTTPPPTSPPPTGSCTSAPGPYPEFTLSCGTSCAAGQAITFTYSSWNYVPQDCDTYSWTFGDGTNSSAQNPQKTYASAGTYTVELKVSNQNGFVTKIKSVTIGGGSTPPPACTTPPGGSMSMSWLGEVSKCTAGSNCNPNENIAFTAFVFGYTPQSCDTWEWNFGDGTTGTGKTVSHKYPNGGSYTVSVKLRNSAGANNGVTGSVLVQDLNVAKPTNVDFAMSTTNPIVGKAVTFTGSATGDPVTNWQWDFGGGSKATGNPATHTFSTAGPWTVTLIASNAGGTGTLSREVKVAAENSYALLLPVVTHGTGHNGSIWRTDLQVYYPYEGEEVELEFELRSATLATTKIMRLDRSTLIAEDFMSFFTEKDNTGPVIVRGNSQKLPQIWTRTYNVAANGIGTYGQLIPAVRLDTTENSATGPTTYYLPGVRLTDRFRTNIGLLNISGNPITVTLTAFEHSFGAAIGQFQETLEPYRFIQIGDGTLRTNFAGHSLEKAFSVMISGANEGDLIAYESMIDNKSHDPVYVSAVPASLASDPGMKHQIVPGVGHFQSWKSDVSIFNPDDQAIQFDLSFYDEKGVLLSQAQNRILPAKGTLQIDDIVNAPEMTPLVGKDVIGTLRLDVDSPLADKFPVITDRTYNDQGEAGTYGQGIIGVPMSRPNVSAGKPAILPAVRQDLAYYTNLGLVNMGEEPSTVLVSLLDKQSGQPIGTWSVSLIAGESIVASRILQAINATADNGSLKIEVTSGAPVWAYASVIDQMTKDPEYVPAVPLD